jgi:hypothetical protein
MPVKDRKLIFELSKTEREIKFRSVLSSVMQKASSLNLPIIYRNELCVKPNLFIHKYPNGRTVLIEQDSKDSTERTVKILR